MSQNEALNTHLFGWGRYRWTGFISRPIFAYLTLCICSFIQNFSVNGANNAVISTLEREFHLDSVQSGLFLALYDVATIFSSLIVGYLGEFYSPSIFFSLNMVIVAFGNIMIGSSNFLLRDSLIDSLNRHELNNLSLNSVLNQCGRDSANQTLNNVCSKIPNVIDESKRAQILLYFGNFINGIGSVALSTIGIAYIERIFPRERAAYCQGIYFAVGTLGAALGIVATGRFLSLYTKLTPKRNLPRWLTPTHPLWIGCWWLPYLIYGSICFLMGLFVSGLPSYKKLNANMAKNLSSITLATNIVVPDECESSSYQNKTIRSEIFSITGNQKTLSLSNQTELTTNGDQKIEQQYDLEKDRLPPLNVKLPISTRDPSIIVSYQSVEEIANNQNITEHPEAKNNSLSNIWSMSLSLLKNPRYVLIVLANLFEGILLKGFVPFVTKYFEYQHQLDTSTATLVTGAIALLSVLIGCPLGAYYMNKYLWTPMRCARVCAVALLVSSVLFLFLILYCPELQFESSTCSIQNKDCCKSIYYPVCDVKYVDRMFYSPCHYGCRGQSSSGEYSNKIYHTCQCSADPTTILSESVCEFRRIPCVWIFIFTMSGAAFVVFLTAFIQVPLLQVLLYCVAQSEQTMALGLRQMTVRVLGQTTGPLLFGYVFDQSCTFWLRDCYERKTCKVYNNRRMGFSMAMSGFFTRTISGFSCFAVFNIWKKITINNH